MNFKTLKTIIKNKKNKSEFAIIRNLATGETELFEKNLIQSKKFEKYSKQINYFFKNKKNGIIDDSDIFIETFKRPVQLIIVGAVHITQYLIDFATKLNFEIYVIDPRGYFANKKRFPDINVLNKSPEEAFKEIETDESTALVVLSHDPKIDDPAIKQALNKNFYYIGALGSKKSLKSICSLHW